MPELTPTGQPAVYSDMTVRLRDEDARALGQEFRVLFKRAVRSGMHASGDGAGQNYLCMIALLPFESTHT